jgi:hypothetical protein
MDFQGFTKISRLSREIIITEKIDGTNGQILIEELEGYPSPDPMCIYQKDGLALFAGSRTRWITPQCDNHGFARWAQDHAEELTAGLGPGRHFGEWWGAGIQRGYGLPKGEKRFSLFNTNRWGQYRDREKYPSDRPACCHVVPVIWNGLLNTETIDLCLKTLINEGSSAAPGFMKPEGIVIFNVAGNVAFKKTIGDDGHKGDRKP